MSGCLFVFVSLERMRWGELLTVTRLIKTEKTGSCLCSFGCFDSVCVLFCYSLIIPDLLTQVQCLYARGMSSTFVLTDIIIDNDKQLS